MKDGLGKVDEGQQDEADNGPNGGKNEDECFQQLVKGPPEGVQARSEDGAPVGHGVEMVVFSGQLSPWDWL